ncbi:MAG: tetratricopeptide repeat protein, partial [Cytophagaceae bacterium]|nr:tetratricopeptide repeat protein [Cytophagaceae bacterium]
MRILLHICFIFSSIATFAQARAQHETFESLLAKGKAEFKKEHSEQDFALAVTYLKKAVTLQPENAEAHYFLGYAYSRLNAKDGKGMIKMD